MINLSELDTSQTYWVCDVRQHPDNPIEQFARKLKPVKVIFMGEDEKGEPYFVKACKDGRPSKQKVSVNGPIMFPKPFKIFESEEECKEFYSKELKGVFLDINHRFDDYKKTCSKALEGILQELQEVNSDGN